MVRIDGIVYNVPVISITRSADTLDKYATRTEDGDLQRELIGVYFNYEITFGTSQSRVDEYEKLWDKLTEPVEFHTIVVPDLTGDFTFTGYISSVTDEIVHQEIDRNNNTTNSYWKNLSCKFTAKKPARSPA